MSKSKSGKTTGSWDLEILKLIYIEWENRQSRLWSLMTKSTTFIFILILLSAISEKFGFNMNTLNIPYYFLPACGIVFAVIIAIIVQAEMLRLIEIKDCIKKNALLLSKNFEGAYSGKNKFNSYVPMVILVIQILAAIVMIISLV